MKTLLPTIIKIENEADVNSYRNSTGFTFPIGTITVSGIMCDNPEGIRPFFSSEDALVYIGEKIADSKPVKKATGPKAAKIAKKKAK